MMEKKDPDVVSVSSVNSDESELRTKGFSVRRILHLIKSRSLDFEPGPCEMSVSALSDKDTVMQSSFNSEAQQTSNTSSESYRTECTICFTEQPKSNFPETIACDHRFCLDCLQTYLKLQITEGRIDISCPKCTAKIHPSDVRDILQNEELMGKYEEFMLRKVLASDPDVRWCPAPDCRYAVIASDCSTCPKLTCGRPGCETDFCYLCKEHWHPDQTCVAARAKKSTSTSSNINQNDYIKPCPECGSLIQKEQDGTCNHMNCPACGAEFCWLCLRQITEFHYISPSGCTYFGKKPWSKRKKRKFQLAALVGAPVLIPVLAGLAAPVMLGTLPYWVGRGINSKYKTNSSIKKKLAMAGGIIASLPFAPVVAGLIVGIGVPALFGYVYGVFMPKFIRKGCLSTNED